jgi:ferric-dicitrate binding protein FerR (iron transport regulator)
MGLLSTAVFALLLFRHGSPLHPFEPSKTYVTAAEQQATITLSDGSRVVLSPRTTLRLIDVGAYARTVEVEGEAYFNVVHAGETPFIVRSGAVTTRVLGTSFLVRHVAGSSRVRVAVEDGKVRVTIPSAANSGATLTAGQFGDVMDSTIRTSKVDEAPSGTEWISGKLVFRHTPVAKILRTLSQWYGYQFKYADETIAQRYVTMGVSTKSSAEALAEIEEVLAVNVTIVGDTITLTPHPATPAHGTPRVRTYDVWTPTREVGR